MDRRHLILLGAMALAGCATMQRPGSVRLITTTDSVFQALEPLYAASSGPGGLSIRVASNGCTAKTDITFHVEMKDGAAFIAFARRKLDACKGLAPVGVDVMFTYAELGVRPETPVFLLNPLNGL
ncbi:hypothetical protein [Caulobacter sp. NIBR2454]|uniref:hypothetical protein n=1 Tax=Caulobacter sp. NIBR2454 TaxID=3015996 RepID=UPI0022B62147|nr:hypothetical protein [Caulobacter sp. NIBR2454]